MIFTFKDLKSNIHMYDQRISRRMSKYRCNYERAMRGILTEDACCRYYASLNKLTKNWTECEFNLHYSIDFQASFNFDTKSFVEDDSGFSHSLSFLRESNLQDWLDGKTEDNKTQTDFIQVCRYDELNGEVEVFHDPVPYKDLIKWIRENYATFDRKGINERSKIPWIVIPHEIWKSLAKTELE